LKAATFWSCSSELLSLKIRTRLYKSWRLIKSTLSDSVATAAVIGRSADHWWHTLYSIGVAAMAWLQGYTVTGPGGLVGRVVAVSPSTSRVLMISDPTSRVGAKVSRSRAMGVIRGQTNNRVVMEFFDKFPDVKAGDVVVTSSYSRLFPRDIAVGRVESIDLTKSPAPEATIQLSAPLSVLEWVVIHPFEPLESVDIPTIPDSDDTDNVGGVGP
jgi:rod shape-determining protein MreC